MRVLGFGARPEFNALWNGLAVAGQTGTLADEFRGSALNGKLHAKTGSLQGVTGLAGFVDDGRAVVFAYLASGAFNLASGVGIRGSVAEIIGQFPDAPRGRSARPGAEPADPGGESVSGRGHAACRKRRRRRQSRAGREGGSVSDPRRARRTARTRRCRSSSPSSGTSSSPTSSRRRSSPCSSSAGGSRSASSARSARRGRAPARDGGPAGVAGGDGHDVHRELVLDPVPDPVRRTHRRGRDHMESARSPAPAKGFFMTGDGNTDTRPGTDRPITPRRPGSEVQPAARLHDRNGDPTEHRAHCGHRRRRVFVIGVYFFGRFRGRKRRTIVEVRDAFDRHPDSPAA